MEIEELVISEDQAEAMRKALKEAIDCHDQLKREKIRGELMVVDGHLRHYGKPMDVYKSFKKVGSKREGDPALVFADLKHSIALRRLFA